MATRTNMGRERADLLKAACMAYSLGKLDALLRKNWSPRVQLLLETERMERLSELRRLGVTEAAFEDGSS